MSHNNPKVVGNVHNLDELLNLVDSDESTSSSDTQIFERNDPFVLELHELKRDELPDNPLPEVTTRKLLKKKKRGHLPAVEHSESSLLSSSASESSVAPAATEAAKEEFYDAHESYHALPENQASAAVANAGVMQEISEHNAPKVTPPAQQPPAQEQATAQQPSTTITKPVTPPE